MSTAIAKQLVLVVDDDPITRTLARESLEQGEFAVEEAEDGEAGLDAFERLRPSIVLLDVMMPVLDGWAVLERLPDVASPPAVIVVSAKTAAADVARAKQLGAADYVTKPFSFPELKRVIDEVASRQRAGEIADAEMARVFNLGIGMVVAVPQRDVFRAIDDLRASGHFAAVIGEVAAGNGDVHLTP